MSDEALSFQKAKAIGKLDEQEKTYKKLWRPLAAYIYLAICVLDFAIMPFYIEEDNLKSNLSVELAKIENFDNYESPVQVKIVEELTTIREWEPLTLQGNGFFHLAFMAILGVAAYTRGNEKKERLSKL